MTMQQADVAARTKAPVVLTSPGQEPIEYVCIVQTGYTYDEKGRHSFVQLLDKSGRSVVNADPRHVEVNLRLVNNVATGNMKG